MDLRGHALTKVKGSNVCYARSYVEEQCGFQARDTLLSHLSAADREQLQSAVGIGWYELPFQHRVFTALDQTLTAAGRPGIAAFAEAIVTRDLTLVHRAFMRLATPLYVLQKAGEYWGRFYDAGNWTYTRSEGSGHVRAELSGIPDVDPIFCEFLTAYVTKLFRLVGAQDVRCTHPRCACRGASSCVFDGHATF
jgi:hypothetical protein